MPPMTLWAALTDVGGMGQTTGFGYGSQSNALTVTDPLRAASR
jgi:hypothetical protein